MVELKPSKSRHAPALEWLDDLSGRDARITAMGSHMLLVENHCGIRCFESSRIAVSTLGGDIEICGREMNLCQVRADALIVRGCIAQIRLPGWEEFHEA